MWASVSAAAPWRGFWWPSAFCQVGLSFSPHMMNEWKGRFLAVLIGCFFPEIFTLSSCLRQYHFVNQSLNWTEAQIYCRQNYRDLATIEDPEELKQLINGVSSAGVGSDVWIGLYNQIHWRWSDGFTGKGADYRNWNTTDSDPDFISANQFCVNIGDGGEWWDRSCGNNFTSICYRGKNIIFLWPWASFAVLLIVLISGCSSSSAPMPPRNVEWKYKSKNPARIVYVFNAIFSKEPALSRSN